MSDQSVFVVAKQTETFRNGVMSITGGSHIMWESLAHKSQMMVDLFVECIDRNNTWTMRLSILSIVSLFLLLLGLELFACQTMPEDVVMVQSEGLKEGENAIPGEKKSAACKGGGGKKKGGGGGMMVVKSGGGGKKKKKG